MTVPGDRFVKRRHDAPPGFFEVEAAGLRWLAVPGGVPVAEPLDVSPSELSTVKLDSLRRPERQPTSSAGGWRSRMTPAPGTYGVPPDGWDGDGYIGTIGLPHALEPLKSWGEFYANLRSAAVPARGVQRRLDRWAPAAGVRAGVHPSGGRGVRRPVRPAEPDPRRPVVGQRAVGADGVHLIDPAAHGGHRETDLAMLGLFGLPHLERVLRAYDEVHPLTDGWRDRVGLHRLHPLLTHVVHVRRELCAAGDRDGPQRYG